MWKITLKLLLIITFNFSINDGDDDVHNLQVMVIPFLKGVFRAYVSFSGT